MPENIHGILQKDTRMRIYIVTADIDNHGDKGVYVEEFELDSNCQKFIGGYSE